MTLTLDPNTGGIYVDGLWRGMLANRHSAESMRVFRSFTNFTNYTAAGKRLRVRRVGYKWERGRWAEGRTWLECPLVKIVVGPVRDGR